jgi:transcriptional regulator with XRE-family HTH domain
MGADDRVLYDSWDLTRPAIPPRSRLFHLEPLGIGTPANESLTGYVARLAEAHGVLARQLVVHEILPLLGRPHLAETRDPNLLSAFWRNETRALNGTRSLARSLVRALESLTGRRDLRFLTLLPWTAVLPVQQLQRPARAWCPTCYAAWRQAGHPVYEPLLWTLAPVTACPRHRRRLRSVCPDPDCGRTAPPLASWSRPGYCARCGGWLGDAESIAPDAPDALTGEELPAHAWIEQAVGELLVAAPDLPCSPSREQLVRAIDASVDRIAGGNRRAWARTLGLRMETVACWAGGRTIPSLGLLLRVCSALGTTPLRFLRGDVGGPDRPTARPLSVPGVPRRPRWARPEPHRQAMRCALEAILAGEEEPPPSLREVAQRLGETTAYLRRHLPDLCRAISERHLREQMRQGSQSRERLRDEIRQAAYRVHAQGRYPSTHRVAQLLNQPVAIRSKPARAAWREVVQELGWQT